MESKYPGRAALVAALVALTVIAVGGNQWATRQIDEKSTRGARSLLQQLSPFRWRVSDFPDSEGLKVAGYIAIVITVVLVFVLVQRVARRSSGIGLWMGVLGATFLAAFIGKFVEVLIGYGALFGAGSDPAEAGRPLWALLMAGPIVAMFAMVVGLIGGGLAAAVGGRRVASASAPPSGSPDDTWGGQAYRGPDDTQALWVPTQAGHPYVSQPTEQQSPPWSPPPSEFSWTESEAAASLDHYGLADETIIQDVQDVQPKPDR